MNHKGYISSDISHIELRNKITTDIYRVIYITQGYRVIHIHNGILSGPYYRRSTIISYRFVCGYVRYSLLNE